MILDICLGYRNQEADQGLCRCGLHWSGVMPMHDSQGRIFSEKEIRRWENKNRKEVEAHVRRTKERQEYEQIGLRHPVAPGYRPRRKE